MTDQFRVESKKTADAHSKHTIEMLDVAIQKRLADYEECQKAQEDQLLKTFRGKSKAEIGTFTRKLESVYEHHLQASSTLSDHFETMYQEKEENFSDLLEHMGSSLQITFEEERDITQEQVQHAITSLQEQRTNLSKVTLQRALEELDLKTPISMEINKVTKELLNKPMLQAQQTMEDLKHQIDSSVTKAKQTIKSLEQNTTVNITNIISKSIKEFDEALAIQTNDALNEMQMKLDDGTKHFEDLQLENQTIHNTDKTKTERSKQMSENTIPQETTPQQPRFQAAAGAILLDKHLPKFDKSDLYVHLTNEKPTQQEMEMFYQTVATKMTANNLPIVLLSNLQPRANCIPTNAYSDYGSDTIRIISQVLYHKILGLIPTGNQHLREIVSNHSMTQDGYRALYELMRATCPWLQSLKPTWGPQWKQDMTAHAYVNVLNSYLISEARANKNYTEYEIAVEMVQQAHKVPPYRNLAAAYIPQLIALPSTQIRMPEEFQMQTLALNFETNKAATSIPPHPQVNKFGGGRNNRTNGPTRDPV